MLEEQKQERQAAANAVGLHLELIRQPDDGRPGTRGELVLWAKDEVRFECKTLELDWEHNAKDVSCIPLGQYQLGLRRVGGFAGRAKEKFGHDGVPWVQNVPGRTFILCHWGNYLSSTAGCVLLGTSHGVSGGADCVWSSKKAYRRFFNAVRPYLDGAATIPFAVLDGTDEEEHDLSADRSSI